MLAGRCPPNGILGAAQLKSLGPYLANHLIWVAVTCPKDSPIDHLAGDVALELWSWCLQPLPRIGRWDLQIARMDARGLSNELAVDLVTKLDRPGRKEDPSDDAMVPANPILFPSSGSIPPQQIFANADPRARILTRGFSYRPRQ